MSNYKLRTPPVYRYLGQIPVVEKEYYDEAVTVSKYLELYIKYYNSFKELEQKGATWDINDRVEYYLHVFSKWGVSIQPTESKSSPKYTQLYWNDPAPIGGNDYAITNIKCANPDLGGIDSDEIYLIKYNSGQSEAEVFGSEITDDLNEHKNHKSYA